MPKGKIERTRSQLHSGSFLLGLSAGFALLWGYQDWQRRQAAAAASIYNRPRQGRIISTSTAPRPIAPAACPWGKLIVGA